MMRDPYARMWLAMALAATLLLTFYLRRVYIMHTRSAIRDAPPRDTRPATMIALSMTLGITAACSFVFNPGPRWLHLFQVVAFSYMYLLNYAFNFWLTFGKPYRFFRNWLIYGIMASTMVTAVLVVASRNNYGHIFTDDVVQPTPVYVAYYSLSVLTVIVVQLLIIRLFIRSIVNNTDLTYRIRRGVGLFAMLGATTSTSSLLVNLALFVFYGTTYRPQLNMVFYTTAPLLLLIPLINAVKQSTLERLAAPIEHRLRRRAHTEHALLTHLHAQLTILAPRVVLRQDALFNDRILVELTHARHVIWSYTVRRLPVTARTEAAHIVALLRNDTTNEQPGPYAAPRPWRTSERKHLVTIARHVQTLDPPPEPEVRYDA